MQQLSRTLEIMRIRSRESYLGGSNASTLQVRIYISEIQDSKVNMSTGSAVGPLGPKPRST